MQFIIDLQQFIFFFFSKFFYKKKTSRGKEKKNKIKTKNSSFWKNSYLVYFLRMDYSREFCSLQLVSRRIIDKRFMAVYFSTARYFFFHKKLLISVNKIFFFFHKNIYKKCLICGNKKVSLCFLCFSFFYFFSFKRKILYIFLFCSYLIYERLQS